MMESVREGFARVEFELPVLPRHPPLTHSTLRTQPATLADGVSLFCRSVYHVKGRRK